MGNNEFAMENDKMIEKGIVSFPEVSRVLSWWRIRKHERDVLLYDLQQEGYLKIIPYHGIMLKEGGQP